MPMFGSTASFASKAPTPATGSNFFDRLVAQVSQAVSPNAGTGPPPSSSPFDVSIPSSLLTGPGAAPTRAPAPVVLQSGPPAAAAVAPPAAPVVAAMAQAAGIRGGGELPWKWIALAGAAALGYMLLRRRP